MPCYVRWKLLTLDDLEGCFGPLCTIAAKWCKIGPWLMLITTGTWPWWYWRSLTTSTVSYLSDSWASCSTLVRNSVYVMSVYVDSVSWEGWVLVAAVLQPCWEDRLYLVRPTAVPSAASMYQ